MERDIYLTCVIYRVQRILIFIRLLQYKKNKTIWNHHTTRCWEAGSVNACPV